MKKLGIIIGAVFVIVVSPFVVQLCIFDMVS